MGATNHLLRGRRFLLFLAIVGLFWAGGAVRAGSAGSCLTVDVDAAVLLPDGSVRQAATLSLCLNRDFSPVAGLHEVSIDGYPVGLLLSRRVASEAQEVVEPFVAFRRDASNRLRLIGYTTSRGGKRQTYMMARPEERSVPASTSGPPPYASGRDATTDVTLAARASR